MKWWAVPFVPFGTFNPFPAMILWAGVLYLAGVTLQISEWSGAALIFLPSWVIWVVSFAVVSLGED